MDRWKHAAVAVILSLGVSSPLLAEEKAGFTPSAARGEATFKAICAHCHTTSYDESRVGAPGLKGVLERYDEKWLFQWIKSPEAFAKIDDDAATLIKSNKYGLKMPTFPEMQDDRRRLDVIEFLKTLKGD